LAVLDDLAAETAALALQALDIPVAITDGTGPELCLIGANPRFEQVAVAVTDDIERLLREASSERVADRYPFPGQPDWKLTCKPLSETGQYLWQAQRRSAEASDELVADWVASASLGDMGLFFFDPKGRLRAYNSGVSHYFPAKTGFPVPGESFGSQLQAILDNYSFEQIGDQRETWRQELTEVFNNPGHPVLGVTPAGRWALATATRMGDGSTLLFLNDVTEFRERDQQLKLYMRNAHGILFSRRELIAHGELRVWGDTKALTASKPVIGSSENHPSGWYDLIDERDRQDYIDFMESRTPESRPYAIEFRYRMLGSDKTRWIRESGWVVRDSKGHNYLDAIYQDITETKNAHKALSSSEERFRQFTELASDWYFELDEDMRVTFISERYEAISGVPSSAIVGNRFPDLVSRRILDLPAPEAAEWQMLLEDWQQHRSTRDRVLKFRDPNGEWRTMGSSAEPHFDDGGSFLGYRGIGRDLTALNQAQDKAMESLALAEKANATKSSFIANVSHELRTPLNAILGFSSIMAEEVLGPMQNERYRRYAADIHLSGNHLLSLVNDLLDMSRVEAGKYLIEDEEIDLHAETERVFTLLQHLAGGRELTNAFISDELLLRADRRAIRQVLINIVANAIKFTSDKGRITVSLSRLPNGDACLSIADDGIGIQADELDRIFEPFGRSETHLAAEGTGLGLPLSRDLIEMHGGTVKIDSKIGEGTRVNITLPAERILDPLPVIKATA
jgi:PAS domain S-box-containing protein